MKSKLLTAQQQQELLNTLENRFRQQQHRHKNLQWEEVSKKLLANPHKLWSLNQMEATGGEPDVIGYDATNHSYMWCDCAPESPQGRRSCCYDTEALESRKKYKPDHSALGIAKEMGIEILTEVRYKTLQKLGEFDQKTSSWIATPPHIRQLGGALFCDRRYNHVFVYHNGAESYYASRGFRGVLWV